MPCETPSPRAHQEVVHSREQRGEVPAEGGDVLRDNPLPRTARGLAASGAGAYRLAGGRRDVACVFCGGFLGKESGDEGGAIGGRA